MKTTPSLSSPPAPSGIQRRFVRVSFLCVLAVLLATSVAGVYFATARTSARDKQQQQQEVDCTLVVPSSPLSAQGLATPYILAGPGGQGDGNGQCHENNPNGAAFVQAAVIDPATGQIGVYDPLVIDRGTQPAAASTVPRLSPNAVVAIWVGFNGNNLQLEGAQGSLAQGACVNGIPGSIFGQNAFCNTTAFFVAANQAIAAGKLQPPALGTAKDGQTCPSSRDFSLVDQDQSDNTTTQYLVTGLGQTAQDEPQNRARLAGAQVAFNGSDERVLAIALDAALGCTPWTVSDLGDSTHTQMLTAWPLNELQAAADQAPPVALIPALDPFTLVNGAPNLQKLNAYRVGVDQPQVAQRREAATMPYCSNLLHVGLPRIAADQQFTSNAPSPFPTMATNLFNFLALRFHNTFSNMAGFLHCTKLLGVQNPVTLQMNDGVVTGATINLNPPPLLNGGKCPLTPSTQGQDVMPSSCCLSAQGQGQIACCLSASGQEQNQNSTPVCVSPTPTVSPSATPNTGGITPTPTASPNGDTPTPTVSPSPTAQGND